MCRRYSTGTDPYFSWHKKQCLDIKKKRYIFFYNTHAHTRTNTRNPRRVNKVCGSICTKDKEFLIELKEKK